MSATVNKCQVSYLEMLGTYPVYQVYMKLSGSEMSYAWPVAGMAGITQEA